MHAPDMKVLVTGATGFIGTRLIERLLAAGMGVRGIHRGRHPDLPGVDWQPVDHIATAPWASLLGEVDAVVHLAALVHQQAARARRAEFARVNTEGTRLLARACQACGVRRLVFLSSISVYGRGTSRIDEGVAVHPEEDYGRSKLAAEQALASELAAGVTDWCVLRPPLVYGRDAPGNMPRLQRLASSGLRLPFGAVRNRRSFMFVDNLLDAITTVLNFRGEIRAAFVLSDGSDFGTLELVRALAVGAGRAPRLLNVPVALLRLLGAGGSALGALGLHAAPDLRTIDSLVGTLTVDSTRFRQKFAWQPPVAAAEGFRLSYGAAPC